MSSTQQGWAAASVYASRLIAQVDKPGDRRLENAARLIRQVDAETMAEFVVRPEVQSAGKSAVAAAGAFGIPHFIENTVAGTAAMKELGSRLLKDYPRFARILQRNPNAAVVAGTVAFPYVIAPLLERWFKDLLNVQRPPGNTPPDWRPGFMATVMNWNNVQPLLNARLANHPALLIMAGPLATALLNAGVDVLNTTEAHRQAGERSATGQTEPEGDNRPPSPTPSEQAVGRAVATQTRYFADTVRQSLRKHPYVSNFATELITTSLYPGWVAAVSNLYARRLSEVMSVNRQQREASASGLNVASNVREEVQELDALEEGAFDPSALDIEAMLRSEGVGELLQTLSAQPDMFFPSRALRSASLPKLDEFAGAAGRQGGAIPASQSSGFITGLPLNDPQDRSGSFEEIDPMAATAPGPQSPR